MIKTRKSGRSILVFVLTALLSLSVVSLPASASTGQEETTVVYNNIKVTVNDRQVQFAQSGSNTPMPFNWNGTIYLPVRAICEALGYAVDYDSSTNTVALTAGTASSGIPAGEQSGTPPTPPSGDSTSGTPPTPPSGDSTSGTPPTPPSGDSNNGTPPEPPTDGNMTGTPPSGTPPTGMPQTGTSAGTDAAGQTSQKTIIVYYNDVKVSLDGEVLELTDANGNTVEAVNYSGSIYLPVRAFAQALGFTVSYEEASNTVVITGGNTIDPTDG